MSFVEFPHSEISGSKDVCSSPKLIAAYHVFHRLPVPRHSPCALCSLTVVSLSQNISYFRFSICQRDFTILLSNFCSSVPLGEIIDFIKNQEFYIANKISFRSSIFSFQGTSAILANGLDHRDVILRSTRFSGLVSLRITFVVSHKGFVGCPHRQPVVG